MSNPLPILIAAGALALILGGGKKKRKSARKCIHFNSPAEANAWFMRKMPKGIDLSKVDEKQVWYHLTNAVPDPIMVVLYPPGKNPDAARRAAMSVCSSKRFPSVRSFMFRQAGANETPNFIVVKGSGDQGVVGGKGAWKDFLDGRLPSYTEFDKFDSDQDWDNLDNSDSWEGYDDDWDNEEDSGDPNGSGGSGGSSHSNSVQEIGQRLLELGYGGYSPTAVMEFQRDWNIYSAYHQAGLKLKSITPDPIYTYLNIGSPWGADEWSKSDFALKNFALVPSSDPNKYYTFSYGFTYTKDGVKSGSTHTINVSSWRHAMKNLELWMSHYKLI